MCVCVRVFSENHMKEEEAHSVTRLVVLLSSSLFKAPTPFWDVGYDREFVQSDAYFFAGVLKYKD